MECKYWILVDEMDIKEEFTYNLSPKNKKEIRKIIFQNFDLLTDSWNDFFLKVNMTDTHKIETICFSRDFININIDGNELTIPLDKLSLRLKSASDIERGIYKISPSGYGIHWPLIDEDISIDGILRDFAK